MKDKSGHAKFRKKSTTGRKKKLVLRLSGKNVSKKIIRKASVAGTQWEKIKW